MNGKEALEQIMEKYMFYVSERSEGKEHLMNCLNIVAKDLERLEKLEKTINEIVIRNRATQITNCFLPSTDGEKEIVNIFNAVLKSINKTLEEAMGEHMNLKEVLENG